MKKTFFSPANHQPATHVLVIGVGEYPYCGTNSAHPSARRVTNLTSPVHTAYAAAKLFIDNKDHFGGAPHAPLASISLLAEPHPNNAVMRSWGGHNPAHDLPTFENVKREMRELQRNKKASDILVLYWCGHGFWAKNEQLLLCRDVGKDGDFFDRVVNISQDQFRTAGSEPNFQVWFIDACSDPINNLNDVSASSVTTLPDGISDEAYANAIQRKVCAVFHAAAPRTQATGDPNQPSTFFRALKRCIEYHGWTPDGPNGWCLDVSSIIFSLVDFFKKSPQIPRYPRNIGNRNLISKTTVSVPVELGSDPHPRQHKNVRHNLTNSTVQFHQKNPTFKRWKLNVPAGLYNLNGQNVNNLETKSAPVFLDPRLREGFLKW